MRKINKGTIKRLKAFAKRLEAENKRIVINKKIVITEGLIDKGYQNPNNISSQRPKPPKGSGP